MAGIRLFDNVLKTNNSLYFADLPGVSESPRESIFTGLNNLKVHTISDVRYEEYLDLPMTMWMKF